METVVFSDIVAVVVAYLAEGFDDLGDSETVFGSRVQTGERTCTVSLVDSHIHDVVVQTSTLRFECRDAHTVTGQQRAHDMAQRARALLGALQGTVHSGVIVYKVTDLGTPGLADVPDELAGTPRYIFDSQISHRGQAIDLDSILTDEVGDPIVIV